MRWTLYVDLDAFYVSCERRGHPELEGRPVIVGPDPKNGPTRGVVLSASYEARSTGVHSAMPVERAARLCPEATWIPPDFAKYERTSQEVRHLLEERFGRVLPRSIDEFALPVETPDAAAARALAEEVRAMVRSELGLPSSVGVAASPTVAKIATDRAKPGGVLVVPPEGTVDFLAPLPVGDIPGVGPKTEALLAGLGIHRIGELRSAPQRLRRELGRFGEEIYRLARGEEPTDMGSPEAGPRSRSAEHTFERDVSDPDALREALERLSDGLAESLGQEELAYRTVTVSVRWDDFKQSQRSRSMPSQQEGADPIRGLALRLLQELLRSPAADGGRRKVRTISVGVQHLAHGGARQAKLDGFAAPEPGSAVK
jgi:nucleotidyltransferase/DNA polymerase involved in DNA repair